MLALFYTADGRAEVGPTLTPHVSFSPGGQSCAASPHRLPLTIGGMRAGGAGVRAVATGSGIKGNGLGSCAASIVMHPGLRVLSELGHFLDPDQRKYPYFGK